MPHANFDDWLGEEIRTAYLFQPISEIEHLIQGDSAHLIMSYMPALEEIIQRSLPMRMQTGLHFSKAQAVRSIEFVRNKTLDWTLELEKQGILGNGMTFGESDKIAAKAVTNNIYGGNFGVLGNVDGGATNSGFVYVNGPVDRSKLIDFVQQVEETFPALPEDVKEKATLILASLKEEAEQKNPKTSRVSPLLGSLRAVMEGASGSLAAQGILSAIAALATG